MPSLKSIFLPFVASAIVIAVSVSVSAEQSKKTPPPPPAHAQSRSPLLPDEYIHKKCGDNCSLLQGPAQFVADLDGDGVDDLVIAARCKNPMADQAEYSFTVADPYDSFMGYSDIKVTSTFASDEPERRGVSLLIVHGVGKDAWRGGAPKAKFLLINLPFKTLP